MRGGGIRRGRFDNQQFVFLTDTLAQRAQAGFDRHGITGDAIPNIVGNPNAGIPQMFGVTVYPEEIRVLTQPTAAMGIGGEMQHGEWAKKTTMFKLIQSTGSMAPYGDKMTGGNTGINVNFPTRAQYLAQINTEWGSLEADNYGTAQINYLREIELAKADVIQRWHNDCALYGIANAGPLYGYLNDPGLPASISPLPNGTGSSPLWANKPPEFIFEDVRRLVQKVIVQTLGNVDGKTPMTLVMSNYLYPELSRVNNFMAKNALQLIQETYPNIRIHTVPQYQTLSGELMQLYVDTVNGQKNAQYWFSIKDMAFPVVYHGSYAEQKHASGTWGAIIRSPVSVASMLGM